MAEFENQTSEFNEIQSEYLYNKEFSPVNEKIADLEEFYNEVKLKEDDSKSKNPDVQNQKSDLSSKLSSMQGETAAKGVTASISSSMGTAVSAIALCVASVGVSAYSGNINTEVPAVESPIQNEIEYVYDDVQEDNTEQDVNQDEQAETNTVDEVKQESLSQFQISADSYNGTYDGNSHSGNIVNVPPDAVITYGESRDSCILREMPEFTDAGEYTVYYEVNREGYETHFGTFVVNIEKNTVNTPAPSVQESVYNGKEQMPVLSESSEYTYSGSMSEIDAGIYKMRLKLNDAKNNKWADGSSEDKVITWVIKPRELTIEWNGEKNYTYDGNRHVIDVTLGNVIPGDFLNFTVKNNAAKEPGTYTAEIISVGGSKNYILPKESSYTWRINRN
ncbi:MAG: hypothetical protein Q4F66_14235 [Clostridium sp.]|nr:hypothetical protein [Clostridium sp.]